METSPVRPLFHLVRTRKTTLNLEAVAAYYPAQAWNLYRRDQQRMDCWTFQDLNSFHPQDQRRMVSWLRLDLNSYHQLARQQMGFSQMMVTRNRTVIPCCCSFQLQDSFSCCHPYRTCLRDFQRIPSSFPFAFGNYHVRLRHFDC